MVISLWHSLNHHYIILAVVVVVLLSSLFLCLKAFLVIDSGEDCVALVSLHFIYVPWKLFENSWEIILINIHKSTERKITYMHRTCTWMLGDSILYNLLFCLAQCLVWWLSLNYFTKNRKLFYWYNAFIYEKGGEKDACSEEGIRKSVSCYLGFSRTQSKRGRCYACGLWVRLPWLETQLRHWLGDFCYFSQVLWASISSPVKWREQYLQSVFRNSSKQCLWNYYCLLGFVQRTFLY